MSRYFRYRRRVTGRSARLTLLTAASAAASALFAPSASADIFYIGPTIGNWSTPANWTGNAVPGPSASVQILITASSSIDFDYNYNPGFAALSDLFITANSPASATFAQSTNALSINNYLTVGYSGGTVYNLSGGSLNVGADEFIGLGGGSPGTFNQSNGSNSVGGILYIGYTFGSTGCYNLGAGSLVAAAGEYVGYSFSTGTFTQTGGTHTVNNFLSLGGIYSGGPGSGIYTLNGGDALLTVNGSAYVGGTTTAGNTGLLNVQSGTMDVTNTLKIWDNGSTIVNLSGGVLNVGALDNVGRAARFNWTGGTLGITGPAGFLVDSDGPLGANVTLGTSQALHVTSMLTNNGQLVVNGSLTAGGLNNAGTLSVTGTNVTIGTGTDAFGIINTGRIKLHNATINFLDPVSLPGVIDTDPSTLTFAQGLTLGSTGSINGGPGDTIKVSGDLVDNSTVASGLNGTTLVMTDTGTQTIHLNTSQAQATTFASLVVSSSTLNILNASNQPVSLTTHDLIIEGNSLPALNGSINIPGASSITGAQTISTDTTNPSGTTVFWTGSGGDFVFSNNANYNNQGVFNAENDQSFTGLGTFYNTGTFRKQASPGTTTFDIPFYNDGLVEVHSGTLRLNAGTSGGIAPTFSVSAGAVLDFHAGTYNLNGITLDTFTGEGTLSFSGANLQLYAPHLGLKGHNTLTGVITAGSISVDSVEYIGDDGMAAIFQSGGTHDTPSLYLGNQTGSTGFYSLSGTGLLNVSTFSEFIGYSGFASFGQTGGTNSIQQQLYLGYITGSTGLYNLGGSGLLSISSSEYVGYSGFGSFNQTGGTHSINGNFQIGTPMGATGIYNLNGAAALLTVSGSAFVGGDIFGGSGTLNIQAGTMTVTGSLTIGTSDNSAVNLSGGLLSVDNLNTSGTPSHFNWTGGTLAITGSDGLYIDSAGPLGNNVSLVAGKALNITHGLFIANGPNNGTFTQTGGTLVANGLEIVGATGFATFSQTGGTHTVNQDLYIGYETVPGEYGSGFYSLSGSGILTVNGSVFVGGLDGGSTGTLNVQNGTLNVANALRIWDNASLSGGLITVGGSENIGNYGRGSFNQTGGTHAITGDLSLAKDTGSLGLYNLSGSGRLTIGGNETIGEGGYAVFDQTGGTHTVTGNLNLGYNSGSSGFYNLSGSGSLTVSNEFIGTNGFGSFNQTGGVHHVNSFLQIGNGATGLYSLSGSGILSVDFEENIGCFNGDFGSFTQTGGSNTTSRLALGFDAGSTGFYTLSGSSLLTVVFYESIGIAGYADFEHNGGTHSIQGTLAIGELTNSVGIYDLYDSGVLTVNNSAYVGGTDSVAGGTGILYIFDGTMAVTNSLKIWDTPNTAVNLDGGLLRVGGIDASGNPSRFNWTAGTLTLTNSSLNTDLGSSLALYGTKCLNIAGGNLSVGALTISTDPTLFNWTAGTLAITGSNGLAIDPNGPFDHLNLANGKTLVISFDESVGNFGAGSLNQSGGTHAVTGSLTLGSGSGSSGTYTLSGGRLSAANVLIGNSGSGTFTQTGGTNVVTTLLGMGGHTGATGVYNLSGTGSISATNLNVADIGTGIFNQTGGTVAIDTLLMGNHPTGNGIYTLNGTNALITMRRGFVGGSSTAAQGNGVFYLQSGVMTVSQTLTIYNSGSDTFYLTGGQLNTGTLFASGNPTRFNWTGGTLSITGNGGIIIGTGQGPLGANLSLDSTKVFNVTKTLTNNGTLSITGGNHQITALANNGTLNFQSNPTLGSTTTNSGVLSGTGAVPASLSLSTLRLNAGGTLNLRLASPGSSDEIFVTTVNGLNLAGTTSINLSDLGGLNPGTYTLIDYAGAFSGTLSNLSLGTTPGSFTYSLVNDPTNTSINLQVGGSSGTPIWLGGTGNWSTGAKWSTGIAPNNSSLHVLIDNSNPSASNVTLDQNATVGDVTLDANDTLNISAGQTLTLAGATASVFNGALNNSGALVLSGSGAILNANSSHASSTFSGANSATLNFHGGSQTFNGVTRFVGSPSNILASGATLLFNSNANIATDAGDHVTFTQTSGLVSTASGDLAIQIGAVAGSYGAYILSGGTLNANSVAFYGSITVGPNGNGLLSVQNSAVAYARSGISVGVNAGSSGSFDHSGGNVSIGGSLVLGFNSGSTGAYHLSQATGNASLTLVGNLYAGLDGSGAFTQDGGTVAITPTDANVGALYIAYDSGSTGSYNLNGGSLSVNGTNLGVYVGGSAGVAGGNGTLNVTAGTLNATSGGGMTVYPAGVVNASGGVINVQTLAVRTGGIVNVSGAATLNLSGNILNNGTLTNTGGTINLAGTYQGAGEIIQSSGTASFAPNTAIDTQGVTIAGGNASASAGLTVGKGNGATGLLTVSGGSLSITGTLGVGNTGGLTGGAGTGHVVLSGGSVYADTILLGSTTGGSGDMTISGNAQVTVGGGLQFNDLNVNGGNLTVLDQNPPATEDPELNRSIVGGYLRNGAMFVNGGLVSSPNIKMGLTAGNTGSYTQTAGSVSVGIFAAGNDASQTSGSGVGIANISGGTLNASTILLGSTVGGSGFMTVSGSALVVVGGGCKHNDLTINGGTFTVLDQDPPIAEDPELNRSIVGGYLRNGNMFVNGGTVTTPKLKEGLSAGFTGVYAQSAGNVTVGILALGNDASMTSGSGVGIASISGGTLHASHVYISSTQGGSGSLTVSGTGILDLQGSLIQHSSNPTNDYATLKGYLTTGKIAALSATAITGIGLMTGSDYINLYGGGGTFDGQPITASDLFMKYTYTGDADFSGNITTNDYALLTAGFFFGNYNGNGNANPAPWVHGDFNSDGYVNYLDFALIDNAFLNQSGTLASDLISQHSLQFGTPYTQFLNSLSTPIPEPASLTLLCLTAPLLLRRRPRSFPFNF